MSTAARNEAAERLLRKAMVGIAEHYPDNSAAVRILLNRRNSDLSNERFREALEEALAAERRATVKGIRARLAIEIQDHMSLKDVARLAAILDEEAAR